MKLASVIRDDVTPDSIAWAKAAAQAERDAIERQTGIRVAQDGTVITPVRRQGEFA